MICAVIFDLDGLVIDSEPLWREAEIAALKTVGHQLTDDDCRKTMGLRSDDMVRYWYRRKTWPAPSIEDVDRMIVTRVIELIREKGKLLPGVLSIIEIARSRGIKLALASSSRHEIIDAALQSLKLQHTFSVVASGQDEPLAKPHPGIYLTTASRLGVEPAECLALEDSVNGVLAAKSARMRCIAVPEPLLRSDRRYGIADRVLPSLTELTSTMIDEIVTLP